MKIYKSATHTHIHIKPSSLKGYCISCCRTCSLRSFSLNLVHNYAYVQNCTWFNGRLYSVAGQEPAKHVFYFTHYRLKSFPIVDDEDECITMQYIIQWTDKLFGRLKKDKGNQRKDQLGKLLKHIGPL